MVTATLLPEPQALRPLLKWAGGKRWLVPELQILWEPSKDRRLVEPFVGGMAVALGLAPEHALLSDRNRHLINLYDWIRRGMTTDPKLVNDEEAYYRARTRFNELIATGYESSLEAARLFYYLNRTAFNGLCRFNRKGEFNVPYGKYKRINYTRDFHAYSSLLDRWSFCSGDFADLRIEPGDFVYADPPYDVPFTAYSSDPFGFQEQERLAHWLASLDVPVVASNQATPRILTLYEKLGFQIRLLKGPRRISCNGDRTPADEMLALKGFSAA